MQITILVATVSQTAENIAKAIAFEFDEQQINIKLLDDTSSIELLQPEQLYLICSSTYNIGDVPDNAAAFYQSFSQTPKDLSKIKYGVIALGDSTYSATFAGGGKKLDEQMQDLGAQRIGDLCILDASSDDEPEAIAVAWFEQWLALALV